MNEDGCHGECIGDETGMLAACPTKRIKGIARYIVPACDGYFFDCFGHIGYCDADKTIRNFFGTSIAAHRYRKFIEFFAYDGGV